MIDRNWCVQLVVSPFEKKNLKKLKGQHTQHTAISQAKQKKKEYTLYYFMYMYIERVWYKFTANLNWTDTILLRHFLFDSMGTIEYTA